MASASSNASAAAQSQLQTMFDFCRLRTERGAAARAAAQHPAIQLVDEVVDPLLQEGHYLPILHAICCPLKQGERVQFLEKKAGLHGPLLFECAMAKAKQIAAEALSAEEKARKLQSEAVPLIFKAVVAMQLLELFLLEKSPNEVAKIEREGVAQIGPHIMSRSGTLEALFENPTIPFYQRYSVLYRAVLSSFFRAPTLEAAACPREEYPLYLYRYSSELLQRLTSPEPLPLPAALNEPEGRGRAIQLAQSMQNTLRDLILELGLGLFSDGSPAGRQRSSDLQAILEAFAEQRLSFDELCQRAAPFLGEAAELAREQVLASLLEGLNCTHGGASSFETGDPTKSR